MKAVLASLIGIAGLPSTKMGVHKWVHRNNIPITEDGKRFTVDSDCLPEPERRALIERDVETAGLPAGTYDETAHERLAEMPPKMRAEAEHKAEIARLLLTVGKALPWSQKLGLVKSRFGAKGVSQPSLTRLLTAIKGVDPINFAPALMADYRLDCAPAAPMSDAAWSFFMTTLRDAGEEFPLKQAWRDDRDVSPQDVSPQMGWNWPSWPTVYRAFKKLPLSQQLHARIGQAEAFKLLAQPALRDKTTILPLEWVSLDGQTKVFWAHKGDGKPRRYTFLPLVDCATNFVLDWELAESENARATVRLIKRTCEKYGIFDRLYTDNGSAFAGHLVAGGAMHRFRNSRQKMDAVKPLGICHHLGIRLHFALPANGQAKTAERTFASLSRVIDDRPEFNGAHAGHGPGAAPDAKVIPVHLDVARAVITREVARHNNEAGRRGQGMNGRSYQAAFVAGQPLRTHHKPTARQLYLAGLIYTPVKVDRWGRVMLDTWTYGGPDTQEDLLPYHKTGQHILLGRDPDDFSLPALAWNADNELICEGIMPVARGTYGSVDGVRDARRNRKAARVAVQAAADANNYLSNAEFEAAMAAIPTPDAPTPAPEAVVAGTFAGSLKLHKPKSAARATTPAIPAEYLKNFDAYLAESEAARTPKLA